MGKPWEQKWIEYEETPAPAPAPVKPWEMEWNIDGMTSAAPVVSPPKPSQSPTEASPEPSVHIKKLLADRGYNVGAIAGIMANIDVETGGTFDYQQKQIKGPGYGLFQLDPSGPLPEAYNQWMAEEGREDSAESQIDFMNETIYGRLQDIIGRGNAKKIRDSFEKDNAEEAAEIFMKLWERPGVPHWDRRKKSAVKFHKRILNNG